MLLHLLYLGLCRVRLLLDMRRLMLSSLQMRLCRSLGLCLLLHWLTCGPRLRLLWNWMRLGLLHWLDSLWLVLSHLPSLRHLQLCWPWRVLLRCNRCLYFRFDFLPWPLNLLIVCRLICRLWCGLTRLCVGLRLNRLRYRVGLLRNYRRLVRPGMGHLLALLHRVRRRETCRGLVGLWVW